ncbi:hypothetical protein HDU67_002539 [Dinochytrium kinnereticum]|nr:hypothetical protein HDU67_002539 [Dinochytrium kinnereticum]
MEHDQTPHSVKNHPPATPSSSSSSPSDSFRKRRAWRDGQDGDDPDRFDGEDDADGIVPDVTGEPDAPPDPVWGKKNHTEKDDSESRVEEDDALGGEKGEEEGTGEGVKKEEGQKRNDDDSFTWWEKGMYQLYVKITTRNSSGKSDFKWWERTEPIDAVDRDEFLKFTEYVMTDL